MLVKKPEVKKVVNEDKIKRELFKYFSIKKV